MSHDDVAAGAGAGTNAPRRSPRQGSSDSPVGSTLSIVLAVVAVIVGFLILRNLTQTDSSADGDTGSVTPEVTSTTIDTGLTTTIATTSTTTVPLVTDGATVVVANGNTIGGSAGRMAEELASVGFTMGTSINAIDTLDDSIVYYDTTVASAQQVAESVARVLGGVSVEPLGTPPPVESGSLDGAGVLLVLGNNQADKTLETLAAEAAGSVTDLGAAPTVAGSEDATEDATEE